MSHVATLIACAVLGVPSISAAQWYSFVDGGPRKAIRVEFDSKSSLTLQLAKIKLPVTALVLRRDTERADYFWLEAHLPETEVIDPDSYLLVINGRSVGQIFYRGHKWAIGFSSLEQARRCLQYLRKYHHLDSEHVRDATKA